MFADPVTITINSVAKTLTRINQDGYSSEYLLREADSELRLKIRNTQYLDKTRGGKTVHRHAIDLTQTVYPVSPATVPVIRKAYAVFENEASDPVTNALNFDLGMTGFLTSGNITKVINFES